MWNRRLVALPAILAALLLSALPAAAADEEECYRCHGRPALAVRFGEEVRRISISADFFESSVHALLNCRECHSDISAIPHPDAKRAVSCGQACHQRDATGKLYSHEPLFWEYSESVHGTVEDMAVGCTTCHPAGSLAELGRRDLLHEAGECGSCHADSGHVRDYFASVHYLALAAGSRRAPACPDCHTSHRVHPAGSENSSLGKDAIADTCGGGAIPGAAGRCHEGVPKDSVAASPRAVLSAPGVRMGGLGWTFSALYWSLLVGLVFRAVIGMLKGR